MKKLGTIWYNTILLYGTGTVLIEFIESILILSFALQIELLIQLDIGYYVATFLMDLIGQSHMLFKYPIVLNMAIYTSFTYHF